MFVNRGQRKRNCSFRNVKFPTSSAGSFSLQEYAMKLRNSNTKVVNPILVGGGKFAPPPSRFF